MTTYDLTQVRDVYDRLHYVERAALAGPRVMLRTYHADGRPMLHQAHGRSATDWEPTILHRANICPHDRSQWTARTFPDGTPGDFCPICNPLDSLECADARHDFQIPAKLSAPAGV